MAEILINDVIIPLSEESNLRLNRLLSDIRTPEKKGGAYSKTISIPGTKEVNTLFGHIFDIKHAIIGTGAANFSPDFNPKKKANATISVHGVELLKGYARLLKIVTDKDQITYEVIIANNVKEFFNVIQNKKLADLDLTHLNHPLTRTNMRNSWDTSYLLNTVATSFSYGAGYVYPLIDKGPGAAQKKFMLPEMYPLVAAREIVSEIFSQAGYSFNAGFFDDAHFKRIYFELLGDSVGGLTNAQLIAREFQASRITSDQALIYGTRLIFNDDSTGDNFDSASAYSTSTGQWTCPTTGKYTIYLNCSFDLQFDNSTGTGLVFLSINKNGKYYDAIGTNVVSKTTSVQVVSVNSAVVTGIFEAGDILDVSVYDVADKDLVSVPYTEVDTLELKTGSIFTVLAEQVSHAVGDIVDFGAIVNKEMTQRDFILNLGKVFNLVFDVDPDNETKIIVDTRDDYFNSTVLDWSQKIDKGSPIDKIPIGELDFKNVDFEFMDGKDLGNSDYSGRYSEKLGSFRYVVDNDFSKATKEVKVGFSVVPSTNYGSLWNAVLPRVEHPSGNKDNNIRMFYYGGVLGCGRYDVKDGPSSAGSTGYDDYPFFSHVDDPNNPTIDILFGMPREVALGLQTGSTYTDNNLFNKYWRNTIEEYSDPSGYILRAKFNLSHLDWITLQMSNKIFVENEAFRINKLMDYDPENDGLTSVELIRAKDLGAFTPTVKGLGRGGDQANGDGLFYPLKKVGTFTPTGNSRPLATGDKATDKGDGGFGKLRTGTSLGSDGNIGVGDNVLFFNSTDCIVGPRGTGAVLINCNALEIDEPGTWVDNVKVVPFPEPFNVVSDTALVNFGDTNIDITLTGEYFREDDVFTISKGTLNSYTINEAHEVVLNIDALASSEAVNTCDVTITRASGEVVTFTELWTYAVAYYGTLADDYVTATGITEASHIAALEQLELDLFAANLITDTGTSTLIKALHLYGGSLGTAAAHKWNFLNALDTDAAFRDTYSGGLTHSTSGITGNGTDGYIDCHFAHSDFAGQNDAHVLSYCRNNTTTGYKSLWGAINTSFLGTIFFPRATANLLISLFGSTGSGTANADASGLWIHSRTGATADNLYRNGALFYAQGFTSNASYPAANILHLATDYNESALTYRYSDANICAKGFGNGLTATQANDYADCLNTYFTTLGLNTY